MGPPIRHHHTTVHRLSISNQGSGKADRNPYVDPRGIYVVRRTDLPKPLR